MTTRPRNVEEFLYDERYQGQKGRPTPFSPVSLQITDLASVQMASLGSHPPILVPAPPMGQALVYLGAWSNQTPGTIPFATPSGAFIVYDGSSSKMDANGDLLGTGSGTYPTDVPFNIDSLGHGGIGIPLTRAIVEGKALVLFGGTDDASGALENANVSVGAGGLLYAIGDTGSLVNGPAYRITAVGAGGAVTGFVITDPPGLPNNFGQTVGAGQPTSVTTGAGDGNFTVDVNSVIPANGTARIWVLYATLILP